MQAIQFRFVCYPNNPYFVVSVHLWYFCSLQISLSRMTFIPDQMDKHGFMWKELFDYLVYVRICSSKSSSRVNSFIWVYTLPCCRELWVSWNISQISIKKTIFVSQPEGTQSAFSNIQKSACDWTGLPDHFILHKEQAAFIVCQTGQMLQTIGKQIVVGTVHTSYTWIILFMTCCQLLSHQKLQTFYCISC